MLFPRFTFEIRSFPYLQIEKMYSNAHSAIRKDPERKPKAKKSVQKKRWTAKKQTLEERKAKIQKAKDDFLSQIEAQRD